MLDIHYHRHWFYKKNLNFNILPTDVPKVKNMPSHLTWALGLKAQLDCPVDANPPIIEIIWVKDNYLLDFQSDKMTILFNGSLLIYQVSQTDQGSYSCTPISSLGTGQTSPLVQVLVRGKN